MGCGFGGARISGQLHLENLSTDVNLELSDCLLEDGVLARDARLASVRLIGCRIEQRGLFLTEGLVSAGSDALGAVHLTGAHISGVLDLFTAVLRNDSGPALTANNLQVSQSLLLRGLFIGNSGFGAVHLNGAHIGGVLDCSGAELRNDCGPALAADGLQVDQSVFLIDEFTATGAGETGTVRMPAAHIGGVLDCSGAVLRNDSGPALMADGLQVGQSLDLRGKFTATGAGETGTVRLTGAHIGGVLDCESGAELRNDSGPALIAARLQVDQSLYLGGKFTASGGGDGVAVNLRGARVGGALVFNPACLEHTADSHRRLVVDGLTYVGVPQEISAQGWLDLLREGTPGYAAQPYQYLAAGYRALGDERQAREILIAQRKHELARPDTRRSAWLWGWITKVTLGYGYKPWRALWFLFAVVVVSCVLAVVLGKHGALEQTDKTRAKGDPCTVVQQVSVGLDLNLPVGASLARAKCDLAMESASVTAAWLSVVGWVLQLAAWAFAALFIAGFTSAVRKT